MFIKEFIAALLVFQVCSASTIFNHLRPLITDGLTTEPGEFPYQVSIIAGDPRYGPLQHICGGSILNERYVLTAGYCVVYLETMKVVLGRYSIKKTNGFEQTIEIAEKYVHEDYNKETGDNNIALLKLKTPIVYNERVKPITLSGMNEVSSESAVVTGWGSASWGIAPYYPDRLTKVDVTLVDNQVCQKAFDKALTGTNEKVNITPSQLCSGSVDGHKGPCKRDNGGPLVQMDGNIPVQIGVVSFGFNPCASGVPSVYTRVSSYVDWISKHIDSV